MLHSGPSCAPRYNCEAFDNVLPADLAITWSKHLKTTAGVTHYQRALVQQEGPAWEHSARIELSVKVLDTEAKLRRTLVHEMCHAAAWLVDHVAKPPHGPVRGLFSFFLHARAHQVFRKWAARVVARCPDLEVTTCHSYEIFYPFRWQCTNAW